MTKFRRALCLLMCVSLCLGISANIAASSAEEPAAPAVSQGQINIVKRARQLLELSWTPLRDRLMWEGEDSFHAGIGYTGAPYGQPVFGKYIGYGTSMDEFLDEVSDSESLFYTQYSTFDSIAPIYANDCSGLISYAWGLETRCTTETIPNVSERVELKLDNFEIGDCLNNIAGHTALISDLKFGENGLEYIEIIEQSPPACRKTAYGAGSDSPLAYFTARFLGGGYALYRFSGRDEVKYTHDCGVPIDGDYCPNCRCPAPNIATGRSAGGVSVTLSHSDPSAAIFYTTDGSAPTSASTPYMGSFIASPDATVKAIAVSPRFSGSRIMSCKLDSIAADASGMSFSDVSAGDWFCDAVSYVYENGLFKGVDGTHFAPQSSMTRGMFITVVGRMAGLDDSSLSSVLAELPQDETALEGLDGTQYYAPYFRWAFASGILDGFLDGGVRADEGITREDMALVLYNYARETESYLAETSGDDFSDAGLVSSGKLDAVRALHASGVINGRGNGLFDPLSGATRAEVAQIIMKFCVR